MARPANQNPPWPEAEYCPVHSPRPYTETAVLPAQWREQRLKKQDPGPAGAWLPGGFPGSVCILRQTYAYQSLSVFIFAAFAFFLSTSSFTSFSFCRIAFSNLSASSWVSCCCWGCCCSFCCSSCCCC